MSLKLAEVLPILTMLTKADGEPLSVKELGLIVAHAEKNELSSASAAVELGLVAASEVPFQLKNQSMERVTAALEDIRIIGKSGMQEQPNWLDVNWDHSKSHQEARELSTTDGAVIVANIAQNMVLVVNHHSELAEEIESYIASAVSLVKGLANLQSASNFSKEKRKSLWDELAQGLRLLVEKSGEILLDAKGGLIDIEEFIKKRAKEIEYPHERLIDNLSAIGDDNGLNKPVMFDKGSTAWRSVF